jgi:transcriptional regulator with XRE-family HTH domain
MRLVLRYNTTMVVKIESFYTEVGRRIRDQRNKLGMTQEQLGRSLSPPTTRVSIANIEGGNQRILAHTLVQLAAALGAEVTDILPQAPEPSNNSTSEIAKELVSKLGISKSTAKKIAGTTKKT